MSKEWSADFSYDFYESILRLINEKYQYVLFKDVSEFTVDNLKTNRVLLRHDIDLDLHRARKMAKIEFNHGIKATYMIMVNCPLYSITEPESKRLISDIAGMGHEIALHVENDDLPLKTDGHTSSEMTDFIKTSVSKLEDVINSKVYSISFHRPSPELINGPLFIENWVNAYASNLIGWFLSDSKGRWREGNPLPNIEDPRDNLLQLLVHPFWWGERHRGARERLEEFYQLRTEKLNQEETDEFDLLLSNHLTIQRKGKAQAN